MRRHRVTVLGGGPAGLLAARLLALEGFEVTLYERLDPALTYGFGVAVAGHALDRLRGVDAEAAERIEAICLPLERWTMCRGAESASIPNNGGFGVERAGLLRTLQRLATEAGATIAPSAEVDITAVESTADVVVLADGVGSRSRSALAEELGVHTSPVPIPYIWCGANLELDSMTLDLRRSAQGIFSAHVMPYGGGRCTFQVDTVAASVQAAAAGDEAARSDSDDGALDFLGELFSPLLGGSQLLGNRSRWSIFRLISCERWSSGKFVLLGDAAHTAHYTVGSGTRMAMEDAIALSQALAGEASLSAAFEAYERDRRPAVEHLQWRANRSQTWWRTLPHRYHLPLSVLLFSYFTRTGSAGLEQLLRSAPDVVAAALGDRVELIGDAELSGVGAPSVSHYPSRTVAEIAGNAIRRRSDLDAGVLTIPCDGVSPWSPTSEQLAHLAMSTRCGVLLTGSEERARLLDRCDVAEELCMVGAGPVAVEVSPETFADGATAVVAGRADYLVVSD